MVSKWQQYGIEAKLIQILKEVRTTVPDHHFGKPYLSAYQLAIEIAQRHPEVVQALGYQLGGRDIGTPNSLAQYLAQQLSQRVHAGKIPQVQGALFADQHLQTLAFRHQGETITSSLTGTGIPLALFRCIE